LFCNKIAAIQTAQIQILFVYETVKAFPTFPISAVNDKAFSWLSKQAN